MAPAPVIRLHPDDGVLIARSSIPPGTVVADGVTTLERIRLLIIDDWGPEPLDSQQRRDLLEIVDDRYDKGSLLITGQVPVSGWHEVIGDPTLGDAILDRIVHRAHRLDLRGESLRRRLAATATDRLTKRG